MYRLFLVLWLIPSLASGITLKDAEKAAVTSSYRVKGLDAKNQSFDFRKDQLTSSLFPKLNLEYSKGRQLQPEKTGADSAMVEFRANLTNPFSFSAQREQLSVQQELVSIEKKNERHKIYYDLRMIYFKTKHLEEKTAQAKRHLETVEKIVAISEKKYTQGRIQVLDKDRSILERARLKQLIDSLNEDYRGKIEILSLLTGHKYTSGQLITSLPDNFDFSFLPPEFKNTILSKKFAIEVKKADADLSLERSKYLPDFYVAYQQSKFDKREKDDRYLVGLTWNLSSERYFASKSIDMERESHLFNQQEEQKTGHIDYTKLTTQLKSLLKKLSSQRKIVGAYQNISKETLKQYNRGVISLKDYYEDFRLLIVEEDTLLQQRFEAVQLLAQLSFLMEDDSVFYKGLKL